MARTYRKALVVDGGGRVGRVVTDHRDQKVGWVYSPRTAERAAKRSARQAARRAALVEAAEVARVV